MNDLKIEVFLTPDKDPEMEGQEYVAVVMAYSEEDKEWYNTGIVKRGDNIYEVFIAAHLATLE